MYKMYDSQTNLGVANIYDLVKETCSTCKRKGKEVIAGEKVE